MECAKSETQERWILISKTKEGSITGNTSTRTHTHVPAQWISSRTKTTGFLPMKWPRSKKTRFMARSITLQPILVRFHSFFYQNTILYLFGDGIYYCHWWKVSRKFCGQTRSENLWALLFRIFSSSMLIYRLPPRYVAGFNGSRDSKIFSKFWPTSTRVFYISSRLFHFSLSLNFPFVAPSKKNLSSYNHV